MIRNRLLATALLASAVLVTGCGGSDTPPPTVETTPGPSAPDLKSPITSLEDDQLIGDPQGDRAAFLDTRMAAIVELGATATRVSLMWSNVATAKPANPTDPADPAYNWSKYDAVIEAAQRNKVEVHFVVWSTPEWAVDPAVPKVAKDPPWGNRRPADPEAFGAFAEAAAKRYSDKGVKRWEVWNEANINFYLRPQYEKQGDRWVAIGPTTYTRLINSFTTHVRSVDPKAIIAGGVMAPVGDKCGLTCPATDREPNRLSPQDFLLGLDQDGLRPPMDAVADHPYPAAGPDRPKSKYAINIYNLQDLFTAIDATYLRGKPVWATEYGWQTVESEVLKYTVSPEEQAYRIAEAYATLRRNPRLELATYYYLQDNGQFNTGLRDINGETKLGAGAFAVPMFAEPRTVAAGGEVKVVGQVRPTAGPTEAVIEWKDGDRWKEVQRVPTSADGTFELTLRPKASVTIRSHWSGAARNGTKVDWTGAEIPLTVQ